MQMLVLEGEDDRRDVGETKNSVDEDEENLFWNGPPSGALEDTGHQTSAVDLRQYWSDEEDLDLKYIVASRCQAISGPVFSLDDADTEDEDCSRPTSRTPCNLNVEWKLPIARKRIRSERDGSDEEFSSPPSYRLRSGKRIRLSEEYSVSMVRVYPFFVIMAFNSSTTYYRKKMRVLIGEHRGRGEIYVRGSVGGGSVPSYAWSLPNVFFF